VGSNGSGKSTLLRLLLGLQPCTEGRRIGHVLMPEARAAVPAMVFQRPFLLSLSAQSNVLLGLWLRGTPRKQRAERCRVALQMAGLQDLGGRPARALSGGQQQRLALARAWATQPDLVALDEATANLDPHGKREVEALMAAFGDSGVTLVFSTHNLGQAKRLATRVVYLEQGRLVVDLPVDRFFCDALPSAAERFLKGELP
jgi:tungstate transport system ATP-binding protein